MAINHNELHRSPAARRSHVITALLLLTIAGSGISSFLNACARDRKLSLEELAAIDAKTTEVLKIGVADHIDCGIRRRGADLRYSLEELETNLGPPYFDLVPLVVDKIDGSEVIMGHRCIANGRPFVHLMFFNGDHLVSLSITRKDGISFPREGAAVTQGIPLYHAKIHDTLELEAAGFETEENLVFLVSEPRNGGTLQVARMLARDLTIFLARRG